MKWTVASEAKTKAPWKRSNPRKRSGTSKKLKPVQIVQTANTVVIVSETIHDARIIPSVRRDHLPAAIRL